MRAFDGKLIISNLSEIDFYNFTVTGDSIEGFGTYDIVKLDYPVRIKDINKIMIYENDIVKYQGDIYKVVFAGGGVYGVRREGKKKHKKYLSGLAEIIGNVYMDEYLNFKDL